MSAPIDLTYPFNGHWLVQNSPANRVPSHGTHAYATAYAIDFVPVTDSGRTAPITPSSFVRPEPADRFPGFGRPVVAPVDGVVLSIHDSEPDHPTYRGLPSIWYALTQRRRAMEGWVALAGNHLLIDSGGIIVALCHLQQDSIEVEPGRQVQAGDAIARCGNSGNSTEPHLHIQAIDDPDITRANAVRMTFNGSLPTNGEVVSA
ncbi:Glycyl-glycine endopeptidase LytM precursor [Corynebacterium atrinae]|uniref:M23 family metallopeptidase n=1 Tax=Corynebacterium atrinae TaxID=1336740 RepID=UPI0025B29306|nr:M23 family metallopeptidase [Corynebacterium atrinae]WJY62914.1 Glycyl-glycine endopeptidase LytM precursor [Corynebacterium atrinae]